MKNYSVIFLIYICFMTSFSECKVFSQTSDSLTTKEIVYYVSPTFTNRSSIGTLEFPFFSLEQARDAIRESRKVSTDKANRYRVVLLSGNFSIKNSFTLIDKDSGTLNAPVIYEGEQKGTVTLNGGLNIPLGSYKKISTSIKGYTTISADVRNQVYYVDLKKIFPEVIIKQDSIQMNGANSNIAPVELCINGKMMTLARYPNTGFATTGMTLDSLTFKFDNDRIAKWENEPNPMILGYLKYGWSFSSNQVTAINVNEKTITLQKMTSYGLGNNRPFYVSNLLSELDAPNEYYIDYKSSILYLMLPQGVELSKSTIEISNLGEGNKSIIEISKASNIIFRNLTFTLGRYGAINVNNSNGITLSELVIHNMGNFGIKATGVNNHFRYLHIMDIGGTGITLTGGDRQSLMSSNNLIENCQIERVSRIQRTYNPAISIAGVGNVIRNCLISDLPHVAILFSGNENRIEKNEIYHVCYETADAGAIYTGRDWGSQGNIIQYNYIHDINSLNKQEGGVHAIYLDDCASGITVKNNIIDSIAGVGVVIGGGRDDIVSGNIITNCNIAGVHVDKRGLESINLKNNDSWNLKEKIEKLNFKSEIWSKKYPKLASIFENGYDDSKLPYGTEVKNNVFWNNKTNFHEGGLGTFKIIIISNNAELKMSPFSTENVKNWIFSSSVLAVFPQGFVSIPISKIGLLK